MPQSSSLSRASFHTANADGVQVFYREAGPAHAPVILLLHGFPSSSHQYRELIPLLAQRYRVIAPDLPGFGFTVVPEERKYVYTFDSMAKTIDAFVSALGLTKYAIYVFDYGAPVGFRLAVAHPERITAIVSQNGNAYEEGLSDGWGDLRRYWADPTPENRDAIRPMVTYKATRDQYLHGVSDPLLVAPESYTLDAALLARPGIDEIQLNIFLNYASNVALYPHIPKVLPRLQAPAARHLGQERSLLHPSWS